MTGVSFDSRVRKILKRNSKIKLIIKPTKAKRIKFNVIKLIQPWLDDLYPKSHDTKSAIAINNELEETSKENKFIHLAMRLPYLNTPSRAKEYLRAKLKELTPSFLGSLA